jgi:hypothetical protein
MKPACPHCDTHESTLLRLVLMCELIRVDEDTLDTIANVLQHLGLVQLAAMDEEPAPPPVVQRSSRLRLVRSTPD